MTAATLYQKRFCANIPLRSGAAIQFTAAAAIMVATRLPALQRTFDDSQTAAVLAGAVLLALVGLGTDGGGRLLSWPAALLLVVSFFL